MANLLLAAPDDLVQPWQWGLLVVLIGLIVFWVMYKKRQK